MPTCDKGLVQSASEVGDTEACAQAGQARTPTADTGSEFFAANHKPREPAVGTQVLGFDAMDIRCNPASCAAKKAKHVAGLAQISYTAGTCHLSAHVPSAKCLVVRRRHQLVVRVPRDRRHQSLMVRSYVQL